MLTQGERMLARMKNNDQNSLPPLTLCEVADPGIPGIESFSPFCMKVHRALAVADFPYQRRFGTHPGAFKKLNPRGQVPVLLVAHEPVADSTEILRSLIRLGAPLEPVDPSRRAEAWLYEELGDTALNGYLVCSRWADDEGWARLQKAYFGDMPTLVRWVLPGRLRSGVLAMLKSRDVLRAGLPAARQRFETLLDQLEGRAPAHGYWCGDSVSVADLGLFPQLQGMRTELTPSWGARVEMRSQLTAWLDRVQAATRIDLPRALAMAPMDRVGAAA